MSLKLFIWEGDGISDAYHDDGTLVVLAETPAQARQLVRDGKAWNEKANEWLQEQAAEHGYQEGYYWRRANEAEFKEYYEKAYELFPTNPAGEWDGTEEALDREPDRTLEIDKPTFVAFNGGGYD